MDAGENSQNGHIHHCEMQGDANRLLPRLDIASLPETIAIGLLGSRGRAEARENSAVVETAARYACTRQKSIPFWTGKSGVTNQAFGSESS